MKARGDTTEQGGGPGRCSTGWTSSTSHRTPASWSGGRLSWYGASPCSPPYPAGKEMSCSPVFHFITHRDRHLYDDRSEVLKTPKKINCLSHFHVARNPRSNNGWRGDGGGCHVISAAPLCIHCVLPPNRFPDSIPGNTRENPPQPFAMGSGGWAELIHHVEAVGLGLEEGVEGPRPGWHRAGARGAPAVAADGAPGPFAQRRPGRASVWSQMGACGGSKRRRELLVAAGFRRGQAGSPGLAHHGL